jgi:hypothetical protein
VVAARLASGRIITVQSSLNTVVVLAGEGDIVIVEFEIELPSMAVENSMRISELLGTFVAALAGECERTVKGPLAGVGIPNRVTCGISYDIMLDYRKLTYKNKYIKQTAL